MRPLHIIMPMAGEGSRFTKEGINTPKPLIEFNNIPLFQRALSSLSNINSTIKYSFIVRKEHVTKFEIDKKIKEKYPDSKIYTVIKTTRGAVETCMLAKPNMEINDSILVLDCDLEFKAIMFEKFINEVNDKNVSDINGGAIISFNSNSSKYSYAEIDDSNNVIRTAEKEVISNHALTGAYFFSKTESFINASNELLNLANFKNPEFYLSLLYNLLIKNEENVKLFKVDTYSSFGTPEELNILKNDWHPNKTNNI